jgi:lysophospholipase L1-like esterase
MISQAWRSRLQARYGNGGRGMLAAGRPYDGYLTWGVTAAQSPGWSVNALFGRAFDPNGAWLGITGYTQTARARGETLSLGADTASDAFDRLIVCAIAQPNGGTLSLQIGERNTRWSLEAPVITSECRSLDSDAAASSASVVTEDARIVSVTSMTVLKREGGVVLSNLGVSGAQLVHLSRSPEVVVNHELSAFPPDLIVVAFGTNEGFSPVLDPVLYEVELRHQVFRLRWLAGRDVPILLLGPPDAATRTPGVLATSCGEGWYVPRRLAEVRERQRVVAHELGLAFWDWSAAMGGACASSAWVRDGLMRGDHVHFTRSGGERVGALLDAAIERATSWRD